MSEYCEECGCPLDICCGERFKADLKKAIAELQGKNTWCVSWGADDVGGIYPQDGEEFFRSKEEAEDFVEDLLVEYGGAVEYNIERAKEFIDGEELLKELGLSSKKEKEVGLNE